MKINFDNLLRNIFLFIFFTDIIRQIKTQDSDLDLYDPCAYVGTSNQKELTDFCLKTDINCCYFAFEWKNAGNTPENKYVYYSCINKRRLIASTGGKNLTSNFIYDVSNESYKILNSILYVNCSDSSDVIVTKKDIEPPSLETTQRLLSDNYNITKLNDTNENY